MGTPDLHDLPGASEGRDWPFAVGEEGIPSLDPGVPWPRITLVTPSFNQVDFLEVTLRSVLLQGYPNLQYFVLDGGSTDGSRELLERYSPWIHFWRSEPDGGQSAAVNDGLAMGDGEIVNWLNSDDYLLPGALETVARAHLATANPLALYAGAGIRVDAAGQLLHRSPLQYPGAHRSPFTGPIIGGVQASWFWTRPLWQSLGGLDAGLRFAMDVDLHLKLGASDGEMVPIEEDLAAFRIHGEAKTSRDAFPAVRERETLLRSFLGTEAYPDDARHRRWLRRDISGLALGWARRAPDLPTALRMIFYAARLYPERLRRGDFWRFSGSALKAQLGARRIRNWGG